MKKTIDISLAGILFHVEEDAYYKLKTYLKAVRNSMVDQEDINEVMHEIEARIAELLLQKQAHPQQVINIQNIEEIIGVMGEPEDFDADNETIAKSQTQRVKKALFRDMSHSVLGGVAAGLAHYIGMDMTIMRLLFIILLFVSHGSFILIYLLLWIVIPKAKTASDKLKMKGEDVNVDNIAEQVSADDETKKKKKLGETVENTTQELGEVITKLLGFVIVLITGLLLTGLIVSATTLSSFSEFNISFLQEPFRQMTGVSWGWVTILGLIITGFPVALLFIFGLKMLFPNTKSLGKNIFVVGGTIWFIAFLFLIVKTSSYTNRHHFKSEVVDKNIVLTAEKDTLYLENKSFIADTIDNFITDNRIYYSYYPSADSLYHLEVIKYATSINKRKARMNTRNIQFDYRIDSLKNKVVFSNKMFYPVENFSFEQKVQIKVYVPSGKFVKITNKVSEFSKTVCKYPLLIQNTNDKIVCVERYEPSSVTEAEQIVIKGKNIDIKVDDEGVDILAGDDDKTGIVIDKTGLIIHTYKKETNTNIKIDSSGINIKKNDYEKERNR
jgi:phage shock protein PspC (stress-responsive transcriptional regulator)